MRVQAKGVLYGFMFMVELHCNCQCSFGHLQAALLVLTQFHANFTPT